MNITVYKKTYEHTGIETSARVTRMNEVATLEKY